MDGWAGRILRIDLSRGNCVTEDLDPIMARDYIGGRGLGVKFLYDEVDPKVEPFNADNKLIFAVGLLTGTGAPSGGRHFVVTKSPLTGAIATSNAAGQFCTELKFAGYDVIIFEGKASEPVYIVINDDDIEIRSAEHLWGKSTSETEDMIRAEVGDKWKARETRVACIGPAGEKLVRVASIMHDKTRPAARSGVGAVMGAKNLKAIVVRGTKDVTVADGEALKEAVMDSLKKIKESAVLGFINTDGTLGAIWINNKLGVIPVRNFLEGSFDKDKAAAVSSRALKANFLVKTYACAACPVACGRVTRVRVEGLEGAGGGPEYETTTKLGPDCGVDNLAAIIKANYLCNELGMDTISVGGTISCAMELYEKGYLSEKEAGYQLNFGNAQALVDLVKKMGLRQDFGDVLAEGGYRVAERYGHPELFMGSKKQELPAYHVQGLQGTGLGFATSNRGACHNRAEMHLVELYEMAGGSVGIAGKAALCKERQDNHTVLDSCGLCFFLSEEGLWPDYVLSFMEAATGAGYALDSMMLAGERIWNVERLFNVGAGLTAKDDTLPKRILEEPVLKGMFKGVVNRLSEMLPEYYRLRGWDENGVPTREKLAELGIAASAVRQAQGGK
jgi:aldehyde:ferredoxin oxidoreductase